MTQENHCYWRWRFQPVCGPWGHVGIDYTFDDPDESGGSFQLYHMDYGLPGNPARAGYRQSIARHSTLVSPGGRDWPPVRTPFGKLFFATRFVPAPRGVGEHLRSRSPRFWGTCGSYRLLGSNSNSGIAAAVAACEAATGYRFRRPPWPWRLFAFGWARGRRLKPHDGPCPGYFEDAKDKAPDSTLGSLGKTS